MSTLLPAPESADEEEHLAVGDHQVDPVEHHLRAEALRMPRNSIGGGGNRGGGGGGGGGGSRAPARDPNDFPPDDIGGGGGGSDDDIPF
jgi:single-strand DNA-binding protein